MSPNNMDPFQQLVEVALAAGVTIRRRTRGQHVVYIFMRGRRHLATFDTPASAVPRCSSDVAEDVAYFIRRLLP